MAVKKKLTKSRMNDKMFQLNEGLHRYVPRLFGQVIEESSNFDSYFWLDNFYIRALLKYGIVIFLCFIVLCSVINYRLWKRKRYYQLLLLSVIPLIGILEALIGDPMYNIFPLLAFSNLDVEEKLSIKEEKFVFIKNLIIGSLLVIWVILSSQFIVLIKTIITGYGLSKFSIGVMMIVLCAISFELTLSIYRIILSIIVEHKLNQIAIKKIKIVVFIMTIIVLIGLVSFSVLNNKYKEFLDEEREVVSYVSANKNGNIYSSKIPSLYEKNIGGFSKILHENELLEMDSVTLLTDVNDELKTFFENGFLYAQISDESAVYTNDDGVIAALHDVGYVMTNYNSSEYEVNLLEESSLNTLALAEDGGLLRAR